MINLTASVFYTTVLLFPHGTRGLLLFFRTLCREIGLDWSWLVSWFAPCFAFWSSIRLSRSSYLAFGVELYLIGAFTGVMTISWLYIDSVWLYVSICVLICGLVNILVSLLIASSFVSLAWLLLLWPDVCLGPYLKFFYVLRLNLVLLVSCFVSCFVSWLVYCSVLRVVSWCVSWLGTPSFLLCIFIVSCVVAWCVSCIDCVLIVSWVVSCFQCRAL